MKNVKRRGKADGKSTDSDVESQTTAQLESKSEKPRTRPAPATSTGSTGSTGSHAAVLLRKVMLLTTQDVTDNSQSSYLLTIIKDIISGTILGVFFLMILIFLDYHNIVQLGSARAFRRAAFELMTDPETVKSIEDSIDVKFIPLDVFKSMQDEIARNQAKAKDKSGYEKHEADWKEKNDKLEEIKKEHVVLEEQVNKVLGLDKWCGGCKAGWGNCDMRIRYLVDTYHSQELGAKLEIIKEGKCLKG
jgi:hypothetical protein